MPQLKIFLWQLCHSSLPTRGTLFRRGLGINPICPFCQSASEDIDHLFLRCAIAQNCWHLAASHNWITMHIVANPQPTVLHMLSAIRNAGPNANMDRIVALLWSI